MMNPLSNRRAAAQRSTEKQLKSLMTAGLDGDSRAHAELLRQVTPLLRGFLARRLNDGGPDIDDLVQESLLALHVRRASFDRDRPFTPWLYALARHKLIDHFRRNSQRPSLEPLDDILATEGFERQSNAHIDLDRLLETLPAKQARVIRQTKLVGRSIADVAASSGLSLADVKVSVHRGLKALGRTVAISDAPVAARTA